MAAHEEGVAAGEWEADPLPHGHTHLQCQESEREESSGQEENLGEPVDLKVDETNLSKQNMTYEMY